MTSSIAAAINPFMGITITEKLGKTNHAMWKAQIFTAVRGSRLVGHLTGASPAPAEEINGKDSAGKEVLLPNPAFEEWFSRDQQVLSFVLGSLGREVLAQVAAQDTTARLWAAIEEMYVSQNRARVMCRVTMGPCIYTMLIGFVGTVKIVRATEDSKEKDLGG